MARPGEELAGLGEVAGTRAGGFSLGIDQRLGVAAALLGQPQTVVLDEPVNGLDPDGVRWIRLLLKSLAAEGRTVFVSSHLMSEVAQAATRLVVLGRGRLISETSVEDFTDHATAGGILVRTPETARLGQLLAAPGVTVINDGTDLLRVSGTTAEQIGTAAWRAHLPVYELTPTHASLEEAFMQVTKDSIEYHAGATR
jgi:ABC-2 type transport system ATP-binding protein